MRARPPSSVPALMTVGKRAHPVLQDNQDVFTWQPADMLGVPRELAEHKLKVYLQARPIRQKLHHFTPHKREAIRDELSR
jgi:hypothetical protein